MSKPKEESDTIDCWSLQDQVEELKLKYHLKKKDSEAYSERSKNDIELNDQIISTLRQGNKAKHIKLKKESEADQRVIKEVFKENRKECLSLQRYAAVEAMDQMNETNFEKAKLLNVMRYQREMRKKKIKELHEEMDRMLNLDKTNSPDCMDFQRTTSMLENSLDKALIKYDTARIITQKYEQILDNLKQGNQTLPAKLESMENSLRRQRAELVELKQLAKEAVAAKDNAKVEFTAYEQQAYDSRRQRDTELNAIKKEVERRKNEAEKTDKKAGRATLLTDQPDQKALLETTLQLEKQNRYLLYEDAMEKIKMASNVTDINNVVSRIEAQAKTRKQLRRRVHDMETMRKRLKEEVTKLQNEFHEMKYTSGKKLSNGEKFLEELTDQMHAEEKNQAKLKENLECNGKSLCTIRTGVITLLEKLNVVKLSPPNHNYTDGDVHNQLDMCMKKINQLLKDVEIEASDNVQEPEFFDYLENQLSPVNIRVRIDESEAELSEFDYDGQENDVLSRCDIKEMGQKMIDNKQKSKKKKTKKKAN